MTDAANAQDAFFSGAEAYERFMGRWSRNLASLLVRFASVRDGDAVLDVGTGTGALAAAVLSIAPSSRIVSIDPAAAYVEYARTNRQSEKITVEVGDAQHLRFEDRTFDRALSLLAFNFIPDAPKAVGEMTRVTRDGGTIAAAVWDYSDGMEMLRVFWDAAIALNPASDNKDERHMPLCRRGELSELWRVQGLQEVAEEGLTIQTRFVSFDDYWVPFLQNQGPAGAYVAALPAGEREALRLQLRRRLLGDGPDRSFALNARAWAVRGLVP